MYPKFNVEMSGGERGRGRGGARELIERGEGAGRKPPCASRLVRSFVLESKHVGVRHSFVYLQDSAYDLLCGTPMG